MLNIDKKELYEKYVNQKLSTLEISRGLGFCVETIRKKT